jgi:hypothetical protein
MKYYFYEINKLTKKYKLIYKSNSKTEGKNFIKNTQDNFYMLLKIKNRNNGEVDVITVIYNFNENNKLKRETENNYLDMVGKINFSKKYLEKNKWTDKYLDNIVKKLVNKEVVIFKLGGNKYNVDFID